MVQALKGVKTLLDLKQMYNQMVWVHLKLLNLNKSNMKELYHLKQVNLNKEWRKLNL